jgi:hypothetical protein
MTHKYLPFDTKNSTQNTVSALEALNALHLAAWQQLKNREVCPLPLHKYDKRNEQCTTVRANFRLSLNRTFLKTGLSATTTVAESFSLFETHEFLHR